MVPRFFGPTLSIKEASLEYMFILMKHLNMSHSDAYNLPLWKRKWFVDKLVYEAKKQDESRQMQANANQQKTLNNSSRRLFGNNS